MTETNRLTMALAVIGVVASTVVAFAADGDGESTALMVAAVIASLVCFDQALTRAPGVFWPWMLWSFAVLAKAVPRVAFDLASEGSLLFARYENGGSILAGGAATAAMVAAARPWGRRFGWLDLTIVVLAGLTGGAVGASIGFVIDPAYGSARDARVFETFGWAAVGGLLVATFISLAVRHVVTWSLAVMAIVAAATSMLVAAGVAGADVDVGWWTLTWAGLTVAAMVSGPRLGRVEGGDRARLVSIAAAVIPASVAVVALAWAQASGSRLEVGPAVLAGSAAALAGAAILAVTRVGATARYVSITTAPASPSQPRARGVAPEADAGDPDQVGTPAAPTDRVGAASPVTADGGEEVDGEVADVASQVEPASTLDELVAELAPEHLDPPTGALSAAGLQRVIRGAFAQPRREGEVSLLMIAVRNLDEIEDAHGRVAAAAVVGTIVRRLADHLDASVVARHRRAGVAVVTEAADGDGEAVLERYTSALLRASEPVEQGAAAIDVDVVGGMAQCYPDEQAGSFVARANSGLERAVGSRDPSLVAMP